MLNEIDPHFIRVVTIGVKPGSGMAEQREAGGYAPQTEQNMIKEQRLLIEHLDGISSYYANHHGIDLPMEGSTGPVARGQAEAAGDHGPLSDTTLRSTGSSTH